MPPERDELDAYLAGAMEDPEFRAAWDDIADEPGDPP